MGKLYQRYLDSDNNKTERIFGIYSFNSGCKYCNVHLSKSDDVVSKHFQGQHGKAYLFNTVVNVLESEPDNRQMTTGLHTGNFYFNAL